MTAKSELAMPRRQHRPTVQVPFFALDWKTKNVREALRLETKKRGCGLLLLRCVDDFRGCRAGVLVRHGITVRPGPFIWDFPSQGQIRISCAANARNRKVCWQTCGRSSGR